MIAILSLLSINLVGCGGNGGGLNPEIDGVVGPNVEFAGEFMVLSMVFTTLNLEGGLSIPIPKHPNSSLAIGPDFQSNGTLLTLSISVRDFDNGSFLDPTQLPGGRPLPGVADGQLPAVAVQVPQLFNTVFYVGPKMLGFFVPTDFLNLDVVQGAILTFKFYSNEGKRVGNVSLVGADTQSKNAGILVLINIDLQLEQMIKDKQQDLILADNRNVVEEKEKDWTSDFWDF